MTNSYNSYKDAIPNQCRYLNSPVQYDEFLETLESFASNTTTVGIDGISYKMLNHLTDSWKQLLHAFYQKRWLNKTLYLEAVSNNPDSKTRQAKIGNCQL